MSARCGECGSTLPDLERADLDGDGNALAKLIGTKATLRLAKKVGGLGNVRIPYRVGISHEWSLVLSPEEWAKVVAEFGGKYINLPRCTFADSKKRRIFELLPTGATTRAIAKGLGCTERYVRRVSAVFYGRGT